MPSRCVFGFECLFQPGRHLQGGYKTVLLVESGTRQSGLFAARTSFNAHVITCADFGPIHTTSRLGRNGSGQSGTASHKGWIGRWESGGVIG